MSTIQTRRNFVKTVSTSTVALGVPFIARQIQAQSPPANNFKLLSSAQLDGALKSLRANPGNFNFLEKGSLPLTAVFTFERAKAAAEFEWHEGRDHVLQIVDGSTVYELGGTPKNGRKTTIGEWLAPACDGATTIVLNKGDWLLIPRNTPHKRTTAGSVTFFLLSTTGAATVL